MYFILPSQNINILVKRQNSQIAIWPKVKIIHLREKCVWSDWAFVNCTQTLFIQIKTLAWSYILTSRVWLCQMTTMPPLPHTTSSACCKVCPLPGCRWYVETAVSHDTTFCLHQQIAGIIVGVIADSLIPDSLTRFCLRSRQSQSQY